MIPDDALKIEVLHHRIIPFDNRDKIIEKQTIKVEIAKLRCANHTLKKGIYDVHTISPHRTVKYGKNGPSPRSCQGLSVTPFHGQEMTVETECLDDDFDTAVFFNGKNFKRYFCYSAPSSTLDLHDKVHYDKFGAHANIFSPIWKH
jgi:hypothetical protein